MGKDSGSSLSNTDKTFQLDSDAIPSSDNSIVLIDSHCHLQDREFFTTEQAQEMLKRAKECKVEKIICIGTDPEDSLVASKFANENEGVYWTYGVHPSEVAKNSDKFKKDDKLVAIGEVGLDYHFEGYDRSAQIQLFEEMLQLACDKNLPVSFHIREAFEDFMAVIGNFPQLKAGVVHSFTGNKRELWRILSQTDFYIGVNGIATYATLPMPPIARVILETDAPFLAPARHRGEKNEPAYVAEIAQWLADKLELPLGVVSKITTENATKLFKLF